MTGPKGDDDDVRPEEMAAYARGLRRSALRDSDPDILASYHAPTPPPAGTDKTVPLGGVRLSATLQRDLADAKGALGKTTPARRFVLAQRAGLRAAWLGAGALALLAVIAGVLVWDRATAPGVAPSAASAAASSPAVLPSAVASVAPAPASAVPAAALVEAPSAPSSSAAPVTATVPAPSDRPKRPPASKARPGTTSGTGGMIDPPL